jgi:hypothetical protein
VSETLALVLEKPGSRSPDDLFILKNGERLLEQFIAGSKIIEGEPFEKGLAPEPAVLSAFEYAFSTLRHLKRLGQHGKASSALLDIRDSLRSVRQMATGQTLKPELVHDLKAFFDALSNCLFDDLAKQRMEETAGAMSKKKVGEPSLGG